MSLYVRIRPAAQRDIDDAARWYESQRPGLGTSFLDEFLAANDDTQLFNLDSGAPQVLRGTRGEIVCCSDVLNPTSRIHRAVDRR